MDDDEVMSFHSARRKYKNLSAAENIIESWKNLDPLDIILYTFACLFYR